MSPQQAFAVVSAPARLILLTEQTRDWEHGRPEVVVATLRRYTAGAAVIVAVDPVAAKHSVARRFGATHAVHPDHVGELSAELTGGEGFDYAFEVVGTPQTIRAAWSAARRGGTVVIVGAGPADQQVEFSPFELLFDGKKMLASLYGSADVRRDYARLLGLWRAGRLDLEGMITQRLKLDDIDTALAAMGSGDIVRQVIIHG